MVNIKGSNILITGGAGFIGSHLVDDVLSAGADNVIIFDNFSSGRNENISHISDSRLKVVKGDILKKEEFDSTVKENDIDIMYHLAAELEVFTGINNIKQDAEINIFGTLNALDLALKYDVKKFLYASSGAVYGQAKQIPENEDHTTDAHWPYGVSKYAGERYCRQFYELNGLPTNSFRFGIVYGPREWFGRVLTMFIKRLFIENKPPVIFGNGNQRRDYIYVKDITEALKLSTENSKVDGEVFNLGSGKGVSVNELADYLIKYSRKDIKVIFDDPKEGEASKHQPERIRLNGELVDFILGSEKAKRMLGWEPQTSFEEGIKKEIEWILDNKKYWDTKPRV